MFQTSFNQIQADKVVININMVTCGVWGGEALQYACTNIIHAHLN